METSNFSKCVLAFALMAALPGLAASLNLKAGAWETTTSATITGTPVPDAALANMTPAQRAGLEKAMQARSQKAAARVRKSCMTQQDLDEDHILRSDSERLCSMKILSKSASRMVFEQTCPAPHAATSTVTMEATTPESLVMDIDVVQGGASGKVHVITKGRWLGASCAGIKNAS
jgi:Protein of unknown function (DUF3617)